jgi:anti-sigma regulatory factor (Ser/Thr protein kinase)
MFLRISWQDKYRWDTMAGPLLPPDEQADFLMTTGVRQLSAADRASWSWITSAARPVPHPALPGSSAGFPRAAAWPVGRDRGLRSAAAVRASARATLQRWGITERGDDIVLVLSELLANALLHARPGPGRWGVAAGLLQPAAGARVLCAVTDPGQDLPRPLARPGQPAPPPPCHGPAPGWETPRPDSPGRESGRGLHVVAELSQQRGYVPGPAGKIAWALIGEAPGLPRRPRQLHPARRGRPAADPALLARVLHGLHAR